MSLFNKTPQNNNAGNSAHGCTPPSFDREERITLQKMVTTIPVTRKMLSPDLLNKAIVDFIRKNVSMGASAANIVNNTVSPPLFFRNLQLVEDCTRRVVGLEPYWKFEGKQPSEQLREITDNKHDIIGAFIERSFYDMVDRLNKKRTASGKQKIFDEYQSSLLSFQDVIDEDNQIFFRELCENCKELKS